MKAYMCHSSHDSKFVIQVAAYLKHCMDVFYYEDDQTASESFVTTMHKAWSKSNVFVVFIGSTFETSNWLQNEMDYLEQTTTENGRQEETHIFTVSLVDQSIPQFLKSRYLIGQDLERYGQLDEYSCANEIVTVLKRKAKDPSLLDCWPPFGLPTNAHLFSYEKDIIIFYKKLGELSNNLFESKNSKASKEFTNLRSRILNGCPLKWPMVVDLVEEKNLETYSNPIFVNTQFRPRSARLAAAAIRGYNTKIHGLDFLEAGPREMLAFPLDSGRRDLNVGILVAGGIAPGVNAVIDGIVQRHWAYAGGPQSSNHTLEIHGYKNGFHSLTSGFPRAITLVPDSAYATSQNRLETSEHANSGGSILGTYRLDKLLNPNTRGDTLRSIVTHLQGIDILYMIGGDGTMKAAHALWNIATKENKKMLSVVAIPKTMDNDVLWMWQSFGFISAVEKAREIVEQLHTEKESNPRLCVLQLFGSDSGFVVSHAVLAGAAGHCDLALIPEVPFSLVGIAAFLKNKISESHRSIPYGLVVMAETAIPVDAIFYLGDRGKRCPIADIDLDSIDLTPKEKQSIRDFDKLRRSKRRIEGQTSDTLRRAGLKLVLGGLHQLLKSEEFEKMLTSLNLLRTAYRPQWELLRMLANEPRHIVRAMPPSTLDIINGQRLGMLAVDNAMAGYTDFMISQWLTEFALIPLPLVVLGRKRIPENGIFWNSVLAKTRQPPFSEIREQKDLIVPWSQSKRRLLTKSEIVA